MSKGNVWKKITILLTFLLILLIVVTYTAMRNAEVINRALGVSTTKVVKIENQKEDEEETNNLINDTEYFKSNYGELNDENLQKLIQDTHLQTIQEATEGSVLLKNENSALPLSSNEVNVTLFGHATAEPLFRNNSAGSVASKTDEGVDLYEALKLEGFNINEKLYSAYKESSTDRSMIQNFQTGEILEYSFGEEDISFYTEELQQTWVNDYNDVAIVMLAREGGEGNELYMEDTQGISQLALHQEEKDLLNMIKNSGKFKKTIVLLNSGNAMEVAWLDEYNVDACLWIGCPGEKGFIGVVDLLTGKANPSGHLTDTYAVNSMSAPATVNNSYNNQTWSNLDYVKANSTDIDTQGLYYAVQAEGIYVGYKYYETRYEDSILNRYGANSNVGSTTKSSWNYNAEVSYPFGFGLSYTEFEQKLDKVKVGKNDVGKDEILVTVTVTNKGNVAGKSVIQVYTQTPYGEYEKTNKVEKSAIQLLNFDKTKVLQPNESQIITISCDPYLLASYDYVKTKGYIVSEGDYYISIGDNAHDALNNILATKNATGMTDVYGNVAEGDVSKTYKWQQKFDNKTYKTNKETGVLVTNKFDDSDINYWNENSVTYLTRQDWENTMPTTPIKVEVDEKMMELLNGDYYVKPENSPEVKSFVQGVDQGLKLVDMMGVDYNDQIWETFINQLTIKEMGDLVADYYGTGVITSIEKPEALAGDGPDGIGGIVDNFKTSGYSTDVSTNCYTAEVVLASTFNKELMASRGELMGEEALFLGLVENWGPGVNLHRTPFGGRNFEYYSEDANMNYLCAIPVVEAFQSNGVSAGVKHVVGNDQENNREGVACFFNEQAFREGALRGAEGAVKVAKAKSIMGAYNRLGLVSTFSSNALNTEVLRGEWGFEGHIETDAVLSDEVGYKSNYTTFLVAGSDSFCLDYNGQSTKDILAQINLNDDGYLLGHLRKASKNILFVVANSNVMNGYEKNVNIVQVTPVWQYICFGIIIILGLFDLMAIRMYINKKRNKTEKSLL